MSDHRIISLIASSTETLCALGFQNNIVGRSHECDYPPSILSLPPCSEAKFNTSGTSKGIDERVINTLKEALSVYRVDVDLLEKLQPTLIVTQDHCEVCAVSLKDVEAAARQVLTTKPKIISLAPNSLNDLIQGIQEIANALRAPEKGETLIGKMNHRMDTVKESVQQAQSKPSVVCVEWIDPLMAAGNWVPELVEMAGGTDLLGIPKAHTPRLPIEKLVEADPDMIISMPCGWDIAKTRQEMNTALQTDTWQSLRAVKNGHLYLTDGNQYFNRPGPRVVDSLEILAEILHPNLCSYGYEGKGWERY